MLLSSLIAGLMACKLGSAADFAVGQKWQIILSNVVDMSSGTLVPADAPVWDIDLFAHDAATIAKIKALGKTVICYFSAGSYEPWRPDANKFTKNDYGNALEGWPDEKWLKTDSANVRSIMTARIQLAAQKGCDAVDPDNTDGYSNNNVGVALTQATAIDYIKFLAKEATGQGMKIGLKNSQEILPQVQTLMSFAVNEQCAQYGDCASYNQFLASGKPVFQIEYPPSAPKPSAQDIKNACSSGGRTAQFSTVIKNLALDGWVMYCDGSTATTATGAGTGGRIPPNGGFPGGGNGGGGGGRGGGGRSTTSRTTRTTTSTIPRPTPTTTSRPPTTTATRPTPTSTSTSRPPFPPVPTTSSASTSESSPTISSTPTPLSTPTTSSIPSTTSSSTSRPPFTPIPPTTTPTPTRPTPATTSTSRAPTPTSSAGGGGGDAGCTVAHWNQCGGQNYKGCTTCASGLTCKGVSPPWYYQCL